MHPAACHNGSRTLSDMPGLPLRGPLGRRIRGADPAEACVFKFLLTDCHRFMYNDHSATLVAKWSFVNYFAPRKRFDVEY